MNLSFFFLGFGGYQGGSFSVETVLCLDDTLFHLNNSLIFLNGP